MEHDCPECGERSRLRSMWQHCDYCGWDEEVQLQEKIREQLANDPGCYD